MTIDTSVSGLLPLVAEGETRLFEAPIKGSVENNFFVISPSHEYSPRLEWKNPQDMLENPRPATRKGPGVSVFSIPVPDLRFKDLSKKLVDYYAINANSYYLSDRLADLIERIDPDSIDRRPVTIKARDRDVAFNLVMPSRSIEAIDVRHTDVCVRHEEIGTSFGTRWLRTIEFPNGVVFDTDKLVGVHNFTDPDILRWCWSRTLIDAAKAAGIKGFYTLRPRTFGPQIDSI
jgi:hypothetical protein